MNSFRKVTLVTISDEEMELAALSGEDCRDMERRAHEMYFGAGSWADIQSQIRRNIFLYSGCDDLFVFNEEPEWDALEDGCDGCGAAPTHRVGRVLLCDNCTEPAPCQCPECIGEE